MDVRAMLLNEAFRHRIIEPNIEAGFAQFVALTGQDVSYDAFCNAVADSLRDGLIREPIRLPEGALQCHWHLELTPAGVREVCAVNTGAGPREGDRDHGD